MAKAMGSYEIGNPVHFVKNPCLQGQAFVAPDKKLALLKVH
jgi:hypothetical protein